MSKLKEKDIQELLAQFLIKKHHKLVTPNVNLFHWESDLVSVTNSDYINEYEIKISRSDFKNDFKKKKFYTLGSKSYRQPNYFYYVTTGSVLKLSELPSYAGYIFVKPNTVKLIKKANRLHTNKLTVRNREYLERGLMYRYWRDRINQF